MTIKQLLVGRDNFCYVIYDEIIKNAAVVDPGFNSSKAIEFLRDNNLNLKYIICTHFHSDHTASVRDLKQSFTEVRVVASEKDGKRLGADLIVDEGSELKLDSISLRFMLTPGHTPGGICIIVDNQAIITGDTLFIDDCGRADLQGGNIVDLFKSLQRIKELSDSLTVFPGHDYGPKPYDSLDNQKKTNKTLLAKNLKEFSKIN